MDSEKEEEECVGPVLEKYPGYFDKPESVYPFVRDELESNVEGDGFPEVLELDYDVPAEELKEKSLFAHACQKSDVEMVLPAMENLEIGDIDQENELIISRMTPEDIAAEREEILKQLKPESVRFLMDKKRKAAETKEVPKKISAYRRSRIAKNVELPVNEEVVSALEAGIKNLEFFDPAEAANEEEGHRYSRLAVNAVQMDLAFKSYALLGSRPLHSWIALFDKLEKTTLTNDDDPLVHRAFQSAQKIKRLYLEEVETAESTSWQFAADVHPTTDGCWMFVPIRRVVDVLTKETRVANSDDLEIIQLAFLFSIWLLKKQATLVDMFATPSDVAIYVAEPFLIGPEIFAESTVADAIHLWINCFLIPKGAAGKLSFSLTKPIAKLDAFLPFYSDLITKYKEYGGGYDDFFKMLLMMATMNSILPDSLKMLQLIFNPSQQIVQQVSIAESEIEPILVYVEKMRECQRQDGSIKSEESGSAFGPLFRSYMDHLSHDLLTATRNPGVLAFVRKEIGSFFSTALNFRMAEVV